MPRREAKHIRRELTDAQRARERKWVRKNGSELFIDKVAAVS